MYVVTYGGAYAFALAHRNADARLDISGYDAHRHSCVDDVDTDADKDADADGHAD